MFRYIVDWLSHSWEKRKLDHTLFRFLTGAAFYAYSPFTHTKCSSPNVFAQWIDKLLLERKRKVSLFPRKKVKTKFLPFSSFSFGKYFRIIERWNRIFVVEGLRAKSSVRYIYVDIWRDLDYFHMYTSSENFYSQNFTHA